jgi:hypothetical protein
VKMINAVAVVGGAVVPDADNIYLYIGIHSAKYDRGSYSAFVVRVKFTVLFRRYSKCEVCKESVARCTRASKSCPILWLYSDLERLVVAGSAVVVAEADKDDVGWALLLSSLPGRIVQMPHS